MKLYYRLLILSVAFLIPVAAQAQWSSVNVDCIGNGGGQVFMQYINPELNRCGREDQFSHQFLYYVIQPDYDSYLSHLYVNNVDRMADLTTNGTGASVTKYYFTYILNTATSIQPVFMLHNTTNLPVIITCVGNGTGSVVQTSMPQEERCGTTDNYVPGFIASYDFLPGQESVLSHLYVNNVDRISEVQTHTSGSSASHRYFSFAVNTATSLVSVFDRTVGAPNAEPSLACSVYPNPSSDGRAVVTIGGVQGSAMVTVYGIDGTLYAQKQITVSHPYPRQFILEDLPKGIYLVRVETAEGTRTVKLIVK